MHLASAFGDDSTISQTHGILFFMGNDYTSFFKIDPTIYYNDHTLITRGVCTFLTTAKNFCPFSNPVQESSSATDFRKMFLSVVVSEAGVGVRIHFPIAKLRSDHFIFEPHVLD